MHKKRKASGVHTSFRKPTKKCAMQMKESRIRKKQHARNNVIDGRGDFIRCLWKGYVMDNNELQMNDS